MLIGIPAFNEALTVGDVIETLPKRIKGIKKIDVLVVDDGSIDNTKDIALNKGAMVVSHALNRGLGGALKTVFEYAKINDYDILVTFDADGQHNGKDITKLIQPLMNKRSDVVIGARWGHNQNVPFSRLFVNQIANYITFVLCGIYTHDSQSGLRSFNRKATNLIRFQTDGMEVSSEIFKEIKNNNLRVKEIPIKAIYSNYSKSKGQKFSDAPDVLFRLFLRLIK